jgi:tetratricopeptide (TPR) repeat protein
LWARPWIASDAAVFYLRKIFWPVPLSVDYGRTPAWVLSHPVTSLSCLLPIAFVLLAWFLRRRWRVVSIAMILFLVLLLPNSGLVSFEYQRVSNVADRYAYLAMVAVALAIAGALATVPAGMVRRVAYGLTIGALVLWAVLTTVQLPTWKNGVALFSHAVAVNPTSFNSYQCLAQADLSAEDPTAALIAATRSIELNPSNEQFRAAARGSASVVPPPGFASVWAEAAQAHISRANALDGLNRLKESADEFAIAVQMNPGNVIAMTDLAFVLGRMGRDAEAQSWLRRALEIDPDFMPARRAMHH